MTFNTTGCDGKTYADQCCRHAPYENTKQRQLDTSGGASRRAIDDRHVERVEPLSLNGSECKGDVRSQRVDGIEHPENH